MSVFAPRPHPDGPVAVYLRTLCFVFCEDDVLLICRRAAPDEGYWNGIGGKIDRGEDPLEAAQRELNEEAGLDVPLTFRGVATVVVRSTGEHWTIFLFSARVASKTVQESSEGPLRWVGLERLSDLKLLPDIPLLLAHLRDRGVTPILAKFTYATPSAGSLEEALIRQDNSATM